MCILKRINRLNKLTIFIILISIFIKANSYLQFTLHKKQYQISNQLSLLKDQCITKNTFSSQSKSTSNQNIYYEELCYFKDIAYYIQLFQNNRLYHIAIDLTSPYSWLKSTQCTVVQTSQLCILNSDGKSTSKHHKTKHHKTNINSHSKSQQSIDQEKDNSNNRKLKTVQTSEQESSQQQQQINDKINNKLARIQGSNQLVQGYLQQNKQIQFWTKDSGRLSRLLDILMLGFYMIQQKQKVALQKTNFINTTRLSQSMQKLCDGALSLRFDQNSQNSFLQQIFEYTQTPDKMITIYINEGQSTLTIGQLSIKNTAQGYGGIIWVPFDNNEDRTAYGKLPLVKSIVLQSLAKDKQQDIEKDEDNNVFVVFSLSASYIGLPQVAMNQLAKQFKNKYKLQCSVSQHSFFQCNSTHSKQQTLTQNLLIQMKQGAVSLPISSLILKQNKKKITLNLRLISRQQNQKQKSFIILGQPYFQKYFTALDYKNNRMGFAIKRTAEHDNFISTVSLIRFVSFLFFAGCCFLLCFQPLKKMFQAFTGGRKFYNKKSPQGRRLKYEPIQQNPYQEVAGTLRRVMQQNQLKQ